MEREETNLQDWVDFLESLTGKRACELRLAATVKIRLDQLTVEEAAIRRSPDGLRESAGNLHRTSSAEATQAKDHLILARDEVIKAIQLIHKLNVLSTANRCPAVHLPESKGGEI